MPKIDWSNLRQVATYATSLGPGLLVVKHKTRANYNITHASRPDLWDVPGVTVIHRT